MNCALHRQNQGFQVDLQIHNWNKYPLNRRSRNGTALRQCQEGNFANWEKTMGQKPGQLTVHTWLQDVSELNALSKIPWDESLVYWHSSSCWSDGTFGLYSAGSGTSTGLSGTMRNACEGCNSWTWLTKETQVTIWMTDVNLYEPVAKST